MENESIKLGETIPENISKLQLLHLFWTYKNIKVKKNHPTDKLIGTSRQFKTKFKILQNKKREIFYQSKVVAENHN